jgi:hypothetical protein
MGCKKSIFSLLLFLQIIMAQGEAGSLFLAINPGARANGMGEAQIGIANDAYATYYNPAGLSNLSSKKFSFMHTSYLPNLVDDMAYVEIDVGSMSHFRSQRKELLVWTFDNMVNNGIF